MQAVGWVRRGVRGKREDRAVPLVAAAAAVAVLISSSSMAGQRASAARAFSDASPAGARPSFAGAGVVRLGSLLLFNVKQRGE